MRRPKYLSPTSINSWVKDPTEFYLNYMSDTPPPRMPQNHHMAIGASFDAFVKSYLHEKLFGAREDMALDAVMNSQVEEHNRISSRPRGEYVFGWYRRLGALDGLMKTLGNSAARFEMDIHGSVVGGKAASLREVPFRVKPDLFFVSEQGASVIFDWKVNGFFSSSGVSPVPGYVLLRKDGSRPEGHASSKTILHKGIYLNAAKGIECYSEEWARQLTIGAWLCGVPIGDPFVGMIHQLVCKPGDKIEEPRVWVAEHVGFVSKEFQEKIYDLAAEIWEIVNSDHIFRHLSKEESAARCSLLDKRREGDSELPPLKESFQWQG